MDSDPRPESAAIFPFPRGGRAASRSKPPERKAAVVTVPTGRGWYHDVAIKDAETAREPKPRT